MKWMSLSVRSKIAASNALVLAALWILTFAGLRILVHRLLDIAVDDELTGRAKSVVAKPVPEAPVSAKPAKTGMAGSAEALATEYIIESKGRRPTSPNVVGGLTVRPTGKHKLKSARAEPIAVVGRTDRLEDYVIIVDNATPISPVPDQNQPVRIFETPLLVDGKEVGIVRAAYPLDELNKLQRSVDTGMFILFPAGLLMVAIYGWWSAGRALKPVHQITQVADTMSVDDLSYRFPIGPEDEFSNLAESFNHMFDRLERAFVAQSQFVSDASHELRTPLAVVKGNLGWLAKTLQLSQAQREPLQDALDASTRMQLLIDDLLCLAKTEASGLEEANNRSNISEICSDCVATLLQRDPNLLITAEIDESQTARMKAEHLRRILLNLIDNACRYGQPGATVKVLSEMRDGFVSISVTNHGEVIAPEVLARLGERFYRPDDSRTRSTGGTGLGLAISKRLCELCGGTLSLSSTAESGTVAKLFLPAN